MEEKLFENKIWDTRADLQTKGDNLRLILPSREYKDELGHIHYIFSKQIFHNPKYIIPPDDFTLFYNFLNGGSREYPSDGNIPVDVVAEEARLVLGRIKEIANDPSHKFHLNAAYLLNSKNELQLIRGAMKFYLGEYTTRDWRRKRSTDDLDFWIADQSLFNYVITEMGYVKNKFTKEWEKKVTWADPWTGILQSGILIASNDINQGLDFGAGAYLEGSSLKDNLKKKLYRGLDVDLSDIINTAILNNIPESPDESSPWAAVKECCNMYHSRVISNIISLCRFSKGIAGYLERVGRSIRMFKETVKNPNNIPNQDILMICRVSSHLLRADDKSTPESTRERIYGNLVVQEQRKIEYSNNLRQFGDRVLNLLNQKFVETVFEIV